MNPAIVGGLVVAGLLVLLVAPLVGSILVQEYRFRRLPPVLQALARHADRECDPSRCPHCGRHPHDLTGGTP